MTDNFLFRHRILCRNKQILILILTLLTASTILCSAENNMTDTLHHIREVVVTSKPTYREVIPTQKLNGKQLEQLNSQSIADAMRYFSGIQIKDYGGVGGIKTVNLRSMGTNHLGVYYDGIELGNAQNGQIDLGQFSLDNIEEITLYNGQKSQIFQPATDFGNAGAVYIRTRVPKFDVGKYYNMRAAVKFASSDVIRTSLLYETKLSPVVCSSFSAEWLNASGKYKFRYKRVTQSGEVAYDTTATRENGDINATRMEANLHGIINNGAWNLKGYTYNSERGIPGAIVNNVWRRGERQWDTNSFVQGHIQKDFGEKFSTQWMTKYAFYRTHYVNNDTTQVNVDNLYKQQEFYLSTSNVYEIIPNWSASVSYDFRWNRMKSDMTGFVFPTRYTNLVSAATAIDYRHLKMQVSILATFVKDHLEKQTNPEMQKMLTPAFFVNLFPFGNKIFSLRAFMKKSFRMPTFNDLYYADMGNSKLNPETALQYDFGFTINKHFGNGLLKEISIQSDGYYNTVHDKIIAYPKGQQFRWTMLNLGKVHITGVDISAMATLMPVKELLITTRLQYTYQKAIDVTDPTDTYYRNQIPYIPWHSGSAVINVIYHSWCLNYSFIYVGKRYNQQENIQYNYMQPWYTSDMSIIKEMTIGKLRCKATLEVNNLLSQDYDVILNYPMPKRNYGLSFTVEI
jgi:vitamin B12 transporter